MAVVQLALRDTPDLARSFLQACGADIGFLRPFDPARAVTLATGKPFHLHFSGFAPLTPTAPPQRVLDLLEPNLRESRQSALWGSSAPLSASVLRVRLLTPVDPQDPHPGWRGTGGELAEIAVRLTCRGVPLGWFRAAATQIRWAKLLWLNDELDPAPWSPLQYGGAFSSCDGDYNEVVAPRLGGAPQPVFLSANNWISGLDFAPAPLVVDDPAFWDRSPSVLNP